MEITRPVGINTMFAEATVGEDGALHLKDTSCLFLKPGQKVALTISSIEETQDVNATPLRGTVTYYEDPFGSATTPEDWETLR